MPTPEPATLRLRLYWSYANLAMAHAAVERGSTKYGRTHWMIRARLYKGLHTGSMSIRSLLDEERLKMTLPRACAYCVGDGPLTLDHLLPKRFGGWDSEDNTVWACRSCNSSKGSRDVLVWWATRDAGPAPLLLVRRYLKLALTAGEHHDALDLPREDLPLLPFFPSPSECRLWMAPRSSG